MVHAWQLNELRNYDRDVVDSEFRNKIRSSRQCHGSSRIVANRVRRHGSRQLIATLGTQNGLSRRYQLSDALAPSRQWSMLIYSLPNLIYDDVF